MVALVLKAALGSIPPDPVTQAQAIKKILDNSILDKSDFKYFRSDSIRFDTFHLFIHKPANFLRTHHTLSK